MIGLNLTIDVLTASGTGNSLGEFIPGYTAGAVGAAGRSQPAHISALAAQEQESLRQAMGGRTKVASHRLFLRSGVTITEGDRVRYGTTKYEVVGVSDVDKLAHHLECLIARIEGVTP